MSQEQEKKIPPKDKKNEYEYAPSANFIGTSIEGSAEDINKFSPILKELIQAEPSQKILDSHDRASERIHADRPTFTDSEETNTKVKHSTHHTALQIKLTPSPKPNISLEQFINALKKRYNTAEFQNIDLLLYEDTQFSIADSFFNLSIASREEQQQKETDELGTDQSHLRENKLTSYHKIYTPKESIALSQFFKEVDHKPPQDHIIIEGRAGIGKSTFCKHLLYLWIHNDSQLQSWYSQFDLIIFLPLRQLLNDDNSIGLYEFIRQECISIEDQEIMNNNIIREMLEKLKGKILFLLDGYDEVHFLQEKQDEKGKTLKLLLSQHYWILTTRPSFLTHKQVGNFRTIEITGFSPEQTEKYVSNFFHKFNKPKEIPKLCTHISKNPNIKAISLLPIQLELICSVWKENPQKLNQSITMSKLYYELTLTLFRRFLKNQKIDATDLTDPEIFSHPRCIPVLNALKSFAWQALQENYSIFYLEQYSHLIKKCFPQNIDERKIIIDDFLNNIGFLRVTGDKLTARTKQKCYFIHLTFQEFFAAWHIADCIAVNISPTPNTTLQEFLWVTQHNPAFEIMYWFVAGLLNIDHSESLENYLSISAVINNHNSLTPYQSLQIIRYSEESDTKTDLFTSQKFEGLVTQLSHLGEQWTEVFINYVNLSPHFCVQIDIEKQLFLLLKKLQEHENQKFKIILKIIANYDFLSEGGFKELIKFLSEDTSRKEYFLDFLTAIRRQAEKGYLLTDLNEFILKYIYSTEDIKKELIKLIAYLPHINPKILDFLLKCLDSNKDDGMAEAMGTLIILSNRKKILSENHHKQIVKMLENILVNTTGWIQKLSAKALIAIKENRGESCREFIKQILNEITPVNQSPLVISSNARTANSKNNKKISFSVNANRRAEILQALLETNSVKVKHILTSNLKPKNKHKQKEEAQLITIIQAMSYSKYYSEEIFKHLISIFNLLKAAENVKECIIDYFHNIRAKHSLVVALLEKNLESGSTLIKVYSARTLISIGKINDQNIHIILDALCFDNPKDIEQSRTIRCHAALTLSDLYLIRPSKEVIKKLLKGFQSEELIVEGVITFRGLILKALGKIGTNFPRLEKELLKLTHDSSQNHNNCYIAEALGYLEKISSDSIEFLLDSLVTIVRNGKQNDALTFGKVIKSLEVHIKKNAAISFTANSYFASTININEWLTLAYILSYTGDLTREHIKKIVNNIEQWSPLCEKILIAFGQSSESNKGILIEICLKALNKNRPRNDSDIDWVLYRAIRQFDLSVHLSLVNSHILLQNTPAKAILKAYFENNNPIFLEEFYYKISTSITSVVISKKQISWFDERGEITLEITAKDSMILKNRFLNFSVQDLSEEVILPAIEILPELDNDSNNLNTSLNPSKNNETKNNLSSLTARFGLLPNPSNSKVKQSNAEEEKEPLAEQKIDSLSYQ